METGYTVPAKTLPNFPATNLKVMVYVMNEINLD